MNKNLQTNKIVEHIKAEYGAEPGGTRIFRFASPNKITPSGDVKLNVGNPGGTR